MKAIAPNHSAAPASRSATRMNRPSCIRSSFSPVDCDLIRKGSAIIITTTKIAMT